MDSQIQPQSSPLPSFHHVSLFFPPLIYTRISCFLCPCRSGTHSSLEVELIEEYSLMNKILTHPIQNRQLGRFESILLLQKIYIYICVCVYIYIYIYIYFFSSLLASFLPPFLSFLSFSPLSGFSEARCHIVSVSKCICVYVSVCLICVMRFRQQRINRNRFLCRAK